MTLSAFFGAMLTLSAACVLMVFLWFVLAIAAHRAPTNCGRACFDAGYAENPAITLIGE